MEKLETGRRLQKLNLCDLKIIHCGAKVIQANQNFLKSSAENGNKKIIGNKNFCNYIKKKAKNGQRCIEKY